MNPEGQWNMMLNSIIIIRGHWVNSKNVHLVSARPAFKYSFCQAQVPRKIISFPLIYENENNTTYFLWSGEEMQHKMPLILADALKMFNSFPYMFLELGRHEAKTNTSVSHRLVQFPHPSRQIRPHPQRGGSQPMLLVFSTPRLALA